MEQKRTERRCEDRNLSRSNLGRLVAACSPPDYLFALDYLRQYHYIDYAEINTVRELYGAIL